MQKGWKTDFRMHCPPRDVRLVVTGHWRDTGAAATVFRTRAALQVVRRVHKNRTARIRAARIHREFSQGPPLHFPSAFLPESGETAFRSARCQSNSCSHSSRGQYFLTAAPADRSLPVRSRRSCCDARGIYGEIGGKKRGNAGQNREAKGNDAFSLPLSPSASTS